MIYVPLLMTKLNEVLSLDHEEANDESSCFYDPINTGNHLLVGATNVQNS